MPATVTPIKRRHKRGCRHCAMVDAYRAARLAAEIKREEATRGWATELAEYPPIITFKKWLIMTAGWSQQYNYAYEEAA